MRRRHRVREILAINQLGSRTPAGPLFIYQSMNDTFIPMEDVNALVAGYCARGATVSYYQDAASEHISLAFSGGPPAYAFLAARFTGRPAPATCSLPRLPGVPARGNVRV